MDGEFDNRDRAKTDGLLPKPIDYVSKLTGGTSRVFPAGTHVDRGEFNRLLRPSRSGRPHLTLDVWHAAADQEGVIWLGINSQTDGDVIGAIEENGRAARYDDSLRLAVYVNNERKVWRIGVSTTPTDLTEEAAYRIVEMLPQEALPESLRITGSGVWKTLGSPRYTKREPGEREDYEGKPSVVGIDTAPDDSLWVTYDIPNYPIELTPAYRNSHVKLRRMGIWEWQEMIVNKYERGRETQTPIAR